MSSIEGMDGGSGADGSPARENASHTAPTETETARRRFLESVLAAATAGGVGTAMSGRAAGSALSGSGRTTAGAATSSADTYVTDVRQLRKLLPTDGDAGDEFGEQVILTADADVAVVTTQSDEDPNGTRAGSAYVFERHDGEYVETQKLVASDGAEEDRFGGFGAVEITDDGSTLLIAATLDDTGAGDDAGTVYVFTRQDGEYVETQRITASDAETGDRFGTAAAFLDGGESVVIGALGVQAPNGNEFGGAAYLFTRDDDSYVERTRFTGSDVDGGDTFGEAVAAADGTVLVGASRDEDTGSATRGTVYVFDRAGTTITEREKLTPAGDDGGAFGRQITLVDGTAYIGAGGETNGAGAFVGAVYVFEESDGLFEQRTKILRENGDEGDFFPSSITVSGRLLLAGAATDEDPNGPGAGAVYLFKREGTEFVQKAKLTPRSGESVDFGRSVVMAGDTLIIGSPDNDESTGDEAGAAYVFTNGPEPIVNETRPMDPDRDRLYEDIDGSGEFDLIDVALFLSKYDTPAVTAATAAYDFNGDGEVDIIDVSLLLEEL